MDGDEENPPHAAHAFLGLQTELRAARLVFVALAAIAVIP